MNIAATIAPFVQEAATAAVVAAQNATLSCQFCQVVAQTKSSIAPNGRIWKTKYIVHHMQHSEWDRGLEWAEVGLRHLSKDLYISERTHGIKPCLFQLSRWIYFTLFVKLHLNQLHDIITNIKYYKQDCKNSLKHAIQPFFFCFFRPLNYYMLVCSYMWLAC